MFKIQTIRTEKQYQAAIARIDELMDSKPGTPGSDELDLVGTLIWAYEQEYEPIYPPNPIDALKYELERRGWQQKELVQYIGAESRVSEAVLNGRRSLTVPMIRKLHIGLNIPLEVLVAESKVTRHIK